MREDRSKAEAEGRVWDRMPPNPKTCRGYEGPDEVVVAEELCAICIEDAKGEEESAAA